MNVASYDNYMLFAFFFENLQIAIGLCDKRSHGTKSAMLEEKLISIPALGH